MSDFVKNAPNAPKGHIAAEAAGLRWLAEPGAVPVVEVLEEEKDSLRLARLEPVGPTPEAAREFGRRLARLHDAGAHPRGVSVIHIYAPPSVPPRSGLTAGR